MDLVAFKIDRLSDSFRLTCDLLACAWYAVNHSLCTLKDQCSLNDRYEPLMTYATTNFENDSNWIQRRRRRQADQTVFPQSEVVTKTLQHPCTQIREQGDEYCVDGDCWTLDLCQRRSDSFALVATISATLSAMIL